MGAENATAISTSPQLQRRGIALSLGLSCWPRVLPLPLLVQSLWLDEASSVWFARLPLGDLLFRLCDPHPPGYYLLLKGWLALGESEVWLRLPSVLASLLAVVLTAWAGHKVLGARAARWPRCCSPAFPCKAGTRPKSVCTQWPRRWAWRCCCWRGAFCHFLAQRARGRRVSEVGKDRLLVARRDGPGRGCRRVAAVCRVQLWWLAHGRPHVGRWLRLQAAVLIPVMLWWLFQRVGADTYHAGLCGGTGPAAGRAAGTRVGRCAAPGIGRRYRADCPGGRVAAFCRARSPAPSRRGPAVTYLLLAVWLLLLAFSAVPRLFSVKRLLVGDLALPGVIVGPQVRAAPPRVVWGTVSLSLAVTLWLLISFQREPWREVVAAFAEASAARPSVAWVDELAVPAFDYYARRVPLGQGDTTWAPLLGADLPALPGAAPPPDGDLWLVLTESPYRDCASFCRRSSINSISWWRSSTALASASGDTGG